MTMVESEEICNIPALSAESLRNLGIGEIAFVKLLDISEVRELVPEGQAIPRFLESARIWGLFGADGMPIMMSNSKQAAESGARHHNLELVQIN